MKPLLYGYVGAQPATSDDEVRRDRRVVEEFAEREGYALAEIFVETTTARPGSARAALVDATRSHDVAAIAVPSRTTLGDDQVTQVTNRARLERDTGVPVLVAYPPPTKRTAPPPLDTSATGMPRLLGHRRVLPLGYQAAARNQQN